VVGQGRHASDRNGVYHRGERTGPVPRDCAAKGEGAILLAATLPLLHRSLSVGGLDELEPELPHQRIRCQPGEGEELLTGKAADAVPVRLKDKWRRGVGGGGMHNDVMAVFDRLFP